MRHFEVLDDTTNSTGWTACAIFFPLPSTLNPQLYDSIELVMTVLCHPWENLASEADKEHVLQPHRQSTQERLPTESEAGDQEEKPTELETETEEKASEPRLETGTTTSKLSDGQPGRHAFVDMVCYGIGSIESSRNSQFQLGLALCLKDILQVSSLNISSFTEGYVPLYRRLTD